MEEIFMIKQLMIQLSNMMKSGKYQQCMVKNNYRLIAVDLSKQKALDGEPRAIQQIVFQELLEKKITQK